jgi:hypothetical protein
MADCGIDELINGECCYVSVDSDNIVPMSNSIIHLNIRSLAPKVSELEMLLNLMNQPKVMLVTKTWLSVYSPVVNISNYCLVSLPRHTGREGGVAAYVHNSVNFIVKDKSSDHDVLHGIDYLLIELLHLKISLCCKHCSPNTSLKNILSILEQVKVICAPNTAHIVSGDFNINLDTAAEMPTDFLNELQS